MASNYGVTQLYAGINPEMDIVAVHGLYGNALKTWTSEKSKSVWLSKEDMLPKAVPSARILTWGYNADVHAFLGDTSSDRVMQHAHTLIAQLKADREIEGATERPIIFTCHSLGGIIVKRALAYSASRTSKNIEHLHSIYVSTYAVLFLGTPHNGSDVAKMFSVAQRLVSAVVPKRIIDTDSQLLNALREGSETLQNITDQFAPLMKRFRIYFFWEQKKTDLAHSKSYIVDESSAAPILDNTERAGIGAKHTHMCKFEDPSSPGYRTVAAALMRYGREAPQLIEARWTQAKDMLKTQRSAEASELIQGS